MTITEAQARAIVELHLASEDECSGGQVTKIEERPHGWLVHTQVPDTVFGGPDFVEKATGRLHSIGSSYAHLHELEPILAFEPRLLASGAEAGSPLPPRVVSRLRPSFPAEERDVAELLLRGFCVVFAADQQQEAWERLLLAIVKRAEGNRAALVDAARAALSDPEGFAGYRPPRG